MFFNLDFQRIVNHVKDFLNKLNGSDTTAELRDSLNFSLLLLHKYYKRLRHKTKVLCVIFIIAPFFFFSIEKISLKNLSWYITIIQLILPGILPVKLPVRV